MFKQVITGLVALGMMAVWSAPGLAGEQPSFILHTEQTPPMHYQGPAGIQGDVVDIVKELFKRAGLPYSLQLEPWSTGFDAAKKNANHGIFSIVRTPAREAQFYWIGPISLTTWVLYARKSGHVKISRLKDVFDYKIGGREGDARVIYLNELGVQVTTTKDDAVNIQRLQHGDIDLWVTGSIVGKWQAEQAKAHDLEEVFASVTTSPTSA